MSDPTKQKRWSNYAVMMHMQDLGAQVVAQSGIPSDMYHLGKLTLQSLKNYPDHILQIDAAFNTSETNQSVLERSIRCAIALKNLGLKSGDVMILMAPNHLDLCIPFYAALYLGILISGIDMTLGVKELTAVMECNEPSIIFCQNDKTADIKSALEQCEMKTHIVTFDEGPEFTYFSSFIGDISKTDTQNFRPTDFDPKETVAFLTTTSGSTGVPKSAELTHKNLALGLPQCSSHFYNFPKHTRLDMCVSPLQWISATIKFVTSPLLTYSRLQTSAPITEDHIYDMINTYKPTSTLMSPNLMTSVMALDKRGRCDFSCLEDILLGGSFVSQALKDTVKEVAPNANIHVMYGMTEASSIAFILNKGAPTGSIGRPMGHLQFRIVDVSTLQDIDEPHVTGELWLKGATIFKGYHKDPENTKAAFTEDGWFKSGDLIYRDEHSNLFYVDRLKALLKYRNHQVSPVELELVIRTHPAVLEAAVVGVPHEEHGDLPAAAVVLQQGASATAQEIKDLVKENLTDSKHLRGGVFFMEELPMTSTSKVDRVKLKKIVNELARQ